MRTHGRWQAIPRLRDLVATPPPAAVLRALDLLLWAAPLRSGDAVALLLEHGVLSSPAHPGGVLSLARLYRVPASVELVWGGAASWLWPLATRDGRRRGLSRLLQSVSSRAVHAVDLAAWAEPYGLSQRELEVVVALDPRLGYADGNAWRVDDRGSGLSRQVVRLLACADSRLELAALHSGIRRARRYGDAPTLTEGQLGLWLSGQPWLRIENATVELVGPLTYRQCGWTTASSTGVLTRALRRSPSGVLSHAELVQALINAGHAPRGASAMVTGAPNLERVRHGHYRLIGRRP